MGTLGSSAPWERGNKKQQRKEKEQKRKEKEFGAMQHAG
jgi:hypothetical protein